MYIYIDLIVSLLVNIINGRILGSYILDYIMNVHSIQHMSPVNNIIITIIINTITFLL